MKVWKEFEGNEITHSMAHYLMAIQDLHKRQGYARVTDVARELAITPGSASVSLKALKVKGLVAEDHNRFLGLTEEGEKIAHDTHVAKNSFLHFFEEVLGVSAEQADIDSCKIEHLVSQETREKLLAFVQFFRTHCDFATKFREEFASYQFHCPGPDNCKMCETDHCDLSCVSPCDKHDHD